MDKCDFCGELTGLPRHYHPMTPISEYLENIIDDLGREEWWKVFEMENPPIDEKTQNTLQLYDQLLNTLGKMVICEKCLERDNKLFEKYYGAE